jgi:hypothetical protein
MQSKIDADSLALFEKNVLFYLMGTPFNPVLDSNYTDVPSGIKIPSKQKKLLTIKCSGITEKQFTEKVMVLLMLYLKNHKVIKPDLHAKVMEDLATSKFRKENNPLEHYGIEYTSFIESLKVMFKKYQNVNTQAKSRLLSNYNHVYRSTLHAHFSKKPNFDFKWVKEYDKLIDSVNEAELEDLKKNQLTADDENIYCELQDKVNSLPDSLRHGFNVVLVQTLIDIKTTTKITSAVQLFWQICYDYNTPCPLIILYIHKKDLFSKSLFPFFHIETFEGASKSLDDKENLNDLSIRLKSRMFMGNLNSLLANDIHPLFLSLKLKELVQDSNLPSIEEYVYFINNDVFQQMKESGAPMSVLAEIHNIPDLSVGSIKHLNQAMSELISLNASIHEFLDDLAILVDSQKEVGKHKLQLERISKEAAKLALNPLDNLDRLQELKEQRTALIESNPSITVSFEQKASKSLAVLLSDIKAFNNVTVECDDDEDDLHGLLLENEQLENELKTIKEQNHQLKNVARIGDDLNNSVSLPAMEIVDLLKSPSITGVIETINATYNTIVLSKKAKDELASLTEFIRFDMLFSKLNVLASPEFISLYESKGSNACFALLTKKELSFQESKSVKNLKTRDFTFDDDVTRDCKAHLKISGGFKEQNVLRLYFKIENKKIYVGMITKHLEVSTT